MKRIFSITLIFLLVSFKLLSAQVLGFKALTCNSQQNPLAIETHQPLFSWIVNADGFNRYQTAYQVLVSTQEALLTDKTAEIWNSGKIKSEQSTYIKFLGNKLLPTTIYYWKVKIWDERGKASDWSPVNTFETGLMEKSNWNKAKWISLNRDSRSSEHRFRDYTPGNLKTNPPKVTSQPVGYFRNLVYAAKEIKSARAYICGLGYYELYINGEKTGNHVLDPAPSNYDKQAYYVCYDVTKQLKQGKNSLGIILGNGFYGQTISWKNDPESEKDLSYGVPAARLLVKITYRDGTQADFYTDEKWKNSTGPIVFDNIYGGDTYDARYEINGWNKVEFKDEKWDKVKVVSPVIDKISASPIPPIRKLQEFEPQNVFQTADGAWIVDFGQNIAGWVKINVSGKKGQIINIITAECLTKKGDDIHHAGTGGGANGMPQYYQYICNGQGVESWEPKFSYHGFRYAKIAGVDAKPDSKMIKAVLVATDIKKTGKFSCSDSLLNKMHQISKWTIVDNLHGIPEDCPHREKCGWLGDSHAFAEYALYNYDMANFYKKYMEDIRTQRMPEKGMQTLQKFLVPSMIAPGKRRSTAAKLDWGVAMIYLPWYSYKFYGDSSIVKEYYSDMKELTDYYLTFKNEKGIIANGMGDWCPPRWDRMRNPEAMECDPIISASAYFYDVLEIMEVFAKMNADAEFEVKMKNQKLALLQAFNNEYLKKIPMTSYQWYGSQTATVMALQFKMVPQKDVENVVEGLAYDIVAEKGGHHATGIHGGRYIYSVLSQYGKPSLAQQILTTPSFPSQAYIMNQGFTTWPERQFFWEAMPEYSNSLNHPMNSGFAAFFYETLGGIKSEKGGFKEFMVNPIFAKSITATSVNVPTPYGIVNNSWEMKNSILNMKLEVPFNTEANLRLSSNELKTLVINGKAWNEMDEKTSGQTYVKLGSGVYEIMYQHDETFF